MGLGCVVSGTSQVTRASLLAGARAIAGLLDNSDIASERILPGIARLNEVMKAVAEEVAVSAAGDKGPSGGGIIGRREIIRKRIDELVYVAKEVSG